jgi:hypothetical protein
MIAAGNSVATGGPIGKSNLSEPTAPHMSARRIARWKAERADHQRPSSAARPSAGAGTKARAAAKVSAAAAISR